MRMKSTLGRFARKVRHFLCSKNITVSQIVDVCEITPIVCCSSDVSNLRINLLIPSVKSEHIFGGISTALRFFEQLNNSLNIDCRIIVTDTTLLRNDLNKFPQYIHCKPEQDISGKIIVALSNRLESKLSVRSSDIFIASAWWTAFCLKEIVSWQKIFYNLNNPFFIYLIQDYEPFFYPTSSRYVLADSTYNNEIETLAIFNTKLLHEYFILNQYKFNHVFYFEPKINPTLLELLKTKVSVVKRRTIFVYGRPDTPRNCFEILVQGLLLWSAKTQNASEWKIISAGSKHNDIELHNGGKITSCGKLTLEEYADLLSECYCGISLMASPHPSYPPLDLLAFGCKVITNQFKNKNLSEVYDNVTSLKTITPNALAIAVENYVNNYVDGQMGDINVDRKFDYVDNREEFDFINKIVNYIEKS